MKLANLGLLLALLLSAVQAELTARRFNDDDNTDDQKDENGMTKAEEKANDELDQAEEDKAEQDAAKEEHKKEEKKEYEEEKAKAQADAQESAENAAEKQSKMLAGIPTNQVTFTSEGLRAQLSNMDHDLYERLSNKETLNLDLEDPENKEAVKFLKGLLPHPHDVNKSHTYANFDWLTAYSVKCRGRSGQLILDQHAALCEGLENCWYIKVCEEMPEDTGIYLASVDWAKLMEHEEQNGESDEEKSDDDEETKQSEALKNALPKDHKLLHRHLKFTEEQEKRMLAILYDVAFWCRAQDLDGGNDNWEWEETSCKANEGVIAVPNSGSNSPKFFKDHKAEIGQPCGQTQDCEIGNVCEEYQCAERNPFVRLGDECVPEGQAVPVTEVKEGEQEKNWECRSWMDCQANADDDSKGVCKAKEQYESKNVHHLKQLSLYKSFANTTDDDENKEQLEAISRAQYLNMDLNSELNKYLSQAVVKKILAPQDPEETIADMYPEFVGTDDCKSGGSENQQRLHIKKYAVPQMSEADVKSGQELEPEDLEEKNDVDKIEYGLFFCHNDTSQGEEGGTWSEWNIANIVGPPDSSDSYFSLGSPSLQEIKLRKRRIMSAFYNAERWCNAMVGHKWNWADAQCRDNNYVAVDLKTVRFDNTFCEVVECSQPKAAIKLEHNWLFDSLMNSNREALVRSTMKADYFDMEVDSTLNKELIDFAAGLINPADLPDKDGAGGCLGYENDARLYLVTVKEDDEPNQVWMCDFATTGGDGIFLGTVGNINDKVDDSMTLHQTLVDTAHEVNDDGNKNGVLEKDDELLKKKRTMRMDKEGKGNQAYLNIEARGSEHSTDEEILQRKGIFLAAFINAPYWCTTVEQKSWSWTDAACKTDRRKIAIKIHNDFCNSRTCPDISVHDGMVCDLEGQCPNGMECEDNQCYMVNNDYMHAAHHHHHSHGNMPDINGPHEDGLSTALAPLPAWAIALISALTVPVMGSGFVALYIMLTKKQNEDPEADVEEEAAPAEE